MRQYRQLSYREMARIEICLQAGMKPCEIAIRLGRNKSTISRFIGKNHAKDGRFNADRAWEKVAERKHRANSHPRILNESLLEKFVLEKIETFWTPEQIAGRWKQITGEPLSHETVYLYIYKHHPEMVSLYFRRRGKKYRNNRQKEARSRKHTHDMRMIDLRPQEVDERRELGHWEGDSIVGSPDKKQIILTNVERKSGYLMAAKSSTRTASVVADLTEDMFNGLPDELRVSITYDQGTEFSLHRVIEASTRMTVYFCHKSSPWERGTNENTNGLLRWFIPKGSNFETVTEKDLQHYVDLLNSRPRKRLNFLTPAEVFEKEVRKKSCSSD